MADLSHPTHHTAQPVGPLTAEAFIADRQHFWAAFTRFTVFAVIAVVLLLILMAVFLV